MLLLCSKCGKVAVLVCLRQVSTLCHFCLFLSCFIGVFNSPVLSHFTKLLTRALSFALCHCSYILVPHLASRVHVAGDLNETISFVVGVFSTVFARALLGLIH